MAAAATRVAQDFGQSAQRAAAEGRRLAAHRGGSEEKNKRLKLDTLELYYMACIYQQDPPGGV